MIWLGDEDEVAGPNAADRTEHLAEFRLELGLPVWIYRVDGFTIEKRIADAATSRTPCTSPTAVLEGTGTVRFNLRPSVQFRGYEAPVDESPVQDLHDLGDRPASTSCRPDPSCRFSG